MVTIKGNEVSEKIRAQVQADLARLGGEVPTLAIVRVGEKADDISYQRSATKKLEKFGLSVCSFLYPEQISDQEFQKEFAQINADPQITGILLLRPLPGQINEKEIERVINPEKDLDGISPINMAKVFAGESGGFAPCTAEAAIEVLKASGIALEGKRVTVIGRSLVVGRPLAMMMLKENATPTICHTRTRDLAAVCREADILVAAAGQARMVDAQYVGRGAVVVDVGIHVDQNGKLCGDVDFEGICEVAAAATPVPGGVGAVTTAVLAKHLIQAALRARAGSTGK